MGSKPFGSPFGKTQVFTHVSPLAKIEVENLAAEYGSFTKFMKS